MSSKLLGYAWNGYLQKNIGIYLASSGSGYVRVVSAIEQSALNVVFTQTKNAFEDGKLFSPSDMAKTEYIEITDPAMHSSPLDPRPHITTRAKGTGGADIKAAHVTQNASDQTVGGAVDFPIINQLSFLTGYTACHLIIVIYLPSPVPSDGDAMRSGIRRIANLSRSKVQHNMRVGQILVGHKSRYRLAQALHEINGIPTVFRGEVLRDECKSIPGKSVIVKTAVAGHDASRDSLIREYMTYRVPRIAASECIRTFYDVIGDPTELNDPERQEYPALVLEYFDTTLQDISPDRYQQNLALLYAITHSVLCSSAVFHEENLVNTDIKPDNILISNIDSDQPIVKVGDLGSVHDDGEAYECQPLAMRSPEVWRGLACQHRSEVWAFAAMLLVWIEPRILGASGVNGYMTTSMWSIAKLMLLFPGWKGPPSGRDFTKDEFEIADALTRELDFERPEEKRVKVASLDEELETMQIPAVLRNLLRSLLIPDIEKRPSASKALKSDSYLALRQLASKTSGSHQILTKGRHKA